MDCIGVVPVPLQWANINLVESSMLRDPVDRKILHGKHFYIFLLCMISIDQLMTIQLLIAVRIDGRAKIILFTLTIGLHTIACEARQLGIFCL